MFFHTNVASHGGYVGYYSVDLKQRWGQGKATRDQIRVQPAGMSGDESQEVAETRQRSFRFYFEMLSSSWSSTVLVFETLLPAGPCQ
jgi:hypothetical protein